jgi:hypothetical protein
MPKGNTMRRSHCGIVLSAAVVSFFSLPAKANLILNATGIADGFSVSTFATGLPSSVGPFGEGPFGTTVVGNGSGGYNVLVEDYANATLYAFNDTDGQVPGSALVTHVFGPTANGFATLNGVAYGGNGFTFGSFSSTGVFTALNIAGLPQPLWGLAADAATGELIASTVGSGLIAINPTTNTFRVINATLSFVDGVSVSPDGQTVYIERSNSVQAYNVTTGAFIKTLAAPLGSYFPDGTGVISSSNALNGQVIVNDNAGNLYLANPVANTITLIGTNVNERGDYTSPDFSNGTLLLVYSDQIARLSCGAGCAIGSVPPSSSVPEPTSLAMLSTGLGALGLLGTALRRKRVTS